ncbi:unnamed protein product [Alopecurus aequalis]
MTLSWCCLLLQVVFAAELVLAAVFDAALQHDPNDIKMTIESKNGEIIDCVDIYKQPSLNNPLLKDSKDQIMRDIATAVAEQEDWDMKTATVEQEWHKSGRQCPTGSIPIMRTDPTVVDLSGIFAPLGVGNTSTLSDTAGAANTTEFAVAIAANGPYRGAYVLLPAWKAARVHESEFAATFLIVGGTVDTSFLPTPGRLPANVTNQIGVGLFANPSLNGGDNNPRLTIFYTPDGGKSQCFNFQCGGFIQTNKAIALGASIADGASGVDDHVPYVLVSVEKDAAGPWHVLVNDTDVGYYPRTIFPFLFPEAVANVVGGAVLNTWPGGKHTDTVMGNGRRPPGDDKTAVVKGYIAINAAGSQVNDRLTLGVHTSPNCYDFNVLGHNQDTPGINVAFGGAGGLDCSPRSA